MFKTKNNPRDKTPKPVKPVKPHMRHMHPDPRVRFAAVQSAVNSIPGVTAFGRSVIGQPVNGYSGIVPFIRTRGGSVRTPFGGKK